ncbi:hypothetical protein GGR51DRAFT_503994 [Nemania sp. FL0031]|nr:hypothetical protein GGR51DRAFT_503994 [Nemania sp. FL0031]
MCGCESFLHPLSHFYFSFLFSSLSSSYSTLHIMAAVFLNGKNTDLLITIIGITNNGLGLTGVMDGCQPLMMRILPNRESFRRASNEKRSRSLEDDTSLD